MHNEPPNYYSRKDLCECLRVSKTSIIRYEAQGALRATKVGPHLVRYSQADVEAFLRRGEEPDQQKSPDEDRREPSNEQEGGEQPTEDKDQSRTDEQ